MEEPLNVAVVEQSAVGHVRRMGAELARQIGFSERDAGRVALVATELAGNAVVHGRDGEATWRKLERADGSQGLELLVLDHGPGILDIAGSLRDGFSTGGTPGTGLGAARRLADRFDIHSMPSVGTTIVVEFWPGGGPAQDPSGPDTRRQVASAPSALQVGGISTPKPGETEIGDAWAAVSTPGRTRVLVVDGLGHGPEAARAAQEAVRAFRRLDGGGPLDGLARIHESLPHTRGAAGAIADIDLEAGIVRYAGVGNIAASVIDANGVDGGATRSMVSMNGFLGHQAPRIVEFTYPWTAGSLLVMHTDGCRTHWQLNRYPGLALRHPSLIAGVLYRDCRRGTDDVTVVVASAGGGSAE